MSSPFAVRRAELGLSLEVLSEELRISVEHLRAIEEGRIEDLPEGPYRSGWVQAYARHIGLDPAQISTSLGVAPDPGPGLDTLWAARAAALAACVGLAGMLYWALREAPASPELDPEAAATAGPAADPSSASPTAAPPFDPPDQRVRLVVQRAGPLKAWVDGAIVVDRQARPGEELVFEARERVEVHLWSTDAARVSWNDEPVQPLGRQDTPRRLIFSETAEPSP